MLSDARALPVPRETRVVVTARARGRAPLDWPRLEPAPPDLSREQLEALLSDAKYPDNVWLSGGEPTLHAQLPELLRTAARPRIGLISDGLPLSDERSLEPLVKAGLSDARVRLCAARLDAHDFMAQQKGAARRALGALRALTKLGVRSELEVKVARMNAAGLPDLVELAAELGLRAVHVERLVLPDDARDLAISWLVRLPLAEPALERAAERAGALGVRLLVRGFPLCFLGRAGQYAASADSLQHLIEPSWPSAPWRSLPTQAALRCDGCSGNCDGAPADYVARFGAAELLAARPRAAGSDSKSASAKPAPAIPTDAPTALPVPPARGERLPTVRLRIVREQARTADLGGDPVPGALLDAPERALRFGWRGSAKLACDACDAVETPRAVETTRVLRQRLVRAAQYGASVLRAVGTDLLHHPAAAELLQELPRLSFDELELCAHLGGALDPAIFPALSRFGRVDTPLFGPDTSAHDAHVSQAGAFARTLESVQRLRDAGVAAGCFALLHSARPAEAFAEAWASERLPGAPAFRLAETGGSLNELADAAARLAPGAAQQALTSLLPACLSGSSLNAPVASPGALFVERADVTAPVASADRLGRFLPCRCGPERAAHCPGVAAGWTMSSLEVPA